MWYIFQSAIMLGVFYALEDSHARAPQSTKCLFAMAVAYTLTRFVSFLINCGRKLINKVAGRQIFKIPPPPPRRPSPLLPAVEARRKRKAIAPRSDG